jgi:hypothetical protein
MGSPVDAVEAELVGGSPSTQRAVGRRSSRLWK